MAKRQFKKAISKKKAKKAGKKSVGKKKRKAKKVSIVGKKYSVFSGKKAKTVGGLKKTDLKKNKAGKVVSKKQSDAAKKGKGYKKIVAWSNAVKAARKALGIKGFQAIGGKTAKGQALLKKVRSLYKK